MVFASYNDVATLGYASMDKGTTGGAGGDVVSVDSLSALKRAAGDGRKSIIVIQGHLNGRECIDVTSDKTIVGARNACLTGISFKISRRSNVIIRNIKMSKALSKEFILICESRFVWIDHVELHADRDHDKDHYGVPLCISRGSCAITVSRCCIRDQFKGAIIGSENNDSEDEKMRITMAYNHWSNLDGKTPMMRAGHLHLFNNLYENNNEGLEVCRDAKVLAENNVWMGCQKAIGSSNGGQVTERGNDFGGAPNEAPEGDFKKVPYDAQLLETGRVAEVVKVIAGATLRF